MTQNIAPSLQADTHNIGKRYYKLTIETVSPPSQLTSSLILYGYWPDKVAFRAWLNHKLRMI